MQTEILQLYLQGCSLCEIARRTGRARQTITKICRLPDVQAKIEELRGKLLGESDDWAESINFAVRHETDGRLAYKLLQAFGAIPSAEKRVPAEKQNNPESIDPELLAKARILGMVALERGATR